MESKCNNCVHFLDASRKDLYKPPMYCDACGHPKLFLRLVYLPQKIVKCGLYEKKPADAGW